MEDVTERERLEAERRLSQKLESVGQLAAGVAAHALEDLKHDPTTGRQLHHAINHSNNPAIGSKFAGWETSRRTPVSVHNGAALKLSSRHAEPLRRV
jgi:hypothetical protein